VKALTQILQRAITERAQPWALATLVRTRGSTTRARLLVDARGETLGVLKSVVHVDFWPHSGWGSASSRP
jgi:XdhC and CoxI family